MFWNTKCLSSCISELIDFSLNISNHASVISQCFHFDKYYLINNKNFSKLFFSLFKMSKNDSYKFLINIHFKNEHQIILPPGCIHFSVQMSLYLVSLFFVLLLHFFKAYFVCTFLFSGSYVLFNGFNQNDNPLCPEDLHPSGRCYTNNWIHPFLGYRQTQTVNMIDYIILPLPSKV